MDILTILAREGVNAAREVLECFARIEDAAFEAFRVLTEERLVERLSKRAVKSLEGIAEARADGGIPNGDEADDGE